MALSRKLLALLLALLLTLGTVGTAACSGGQAVAPAESSGTADTGESVSTDYFSYEEMLTRASLLSDITYTLAFELDATSETYALSEEVSFSAEPGAESFIDARLTNIERIELNGTELDLETVYDEARGRIQLAGLESTNTLRLVATNEYSLSGTGITREDSLEDEGKTFIYTQYETANAQAVFACFDQPNLKAHFTLSVDAPEQWVVITATEPAGETTVQGGTRHWEFASSPLMSTYLSSLIAGEYVQATSTYEAADGRQVPLSFYARPSMAEQTDFDRLFDLTKAGFVYFEREFDTAFPYEKYDQIFVPDFPWGGMENIGAVTLREDIAVDLSLTNRMYGEATVLHELAHQWFGNLVTMEWWNDLWLNEAFAEFIAYQAAAAIAGNDDYLMDAQRQMRPGAVAQDQSPTTHAIALDKNITIEEAETLVDDITYYKGSMVLRQLHALVGAESFRSGLHDYFAHHAEANASLSDFIAAFQPYVDIDMESWSEEWLTTTGVNTLTPVVETDEQGRIERLAVSQTAESYTDGANTPLLRTHRLEIGLYDLVSEGGTEQLVLRETHEVLVSGAETEVPAAIGAERPDLILIDRTGRDYSKVVFDEVSLATLEQHIGALDEPFARMLALLDLRQMAFDLKYSASRTLEIITDALRATQNPYELAVFGTITLGSYSIDTTLFSLVADENLERCTGSVADALVDALDAGTFEAWGEDTTVLFQILQIHSSSEKSVAFLRGVMAGTAVWRAPGNRFNALSALIAAGQASADDIDGLAAELGADDPSIVSWSEYIKKQLPTAEAKQDLLDTYFTGSELSFVEMSSAYGLYNPSVRYPDANRVYAGLDEIYFERLQAFIENNQSELSVRLIQSFYPFSLVEQTTVERAEAWIAAHPDTEQTLLEKLNWFVQEQKNGLLGRAVDLRYTE
jgi:aminopeptidase N